MVTLSAAPTFAFKIGHKQSVPESIPIEVADIRNKDQLNAVFSKHKPDAVMHFCASIEVGESVTDPLSFYENNVSGTILLLQVMVAHGVQKFIFSSTAALFGNPERSPIQEEDRCLPTNPYGDSKLVIEVLLKSCDSAYGLKSVCLRYFNACGADEAGDIGEDHDPESHLLPVVLQVSDSGFP